VTEGTELATQGQGAPVVIAEGPGALLSNLWQMGRDPSIRPEVIAALVGMQERLEDRQAEREFNAAFVRLQPRLPRIKKDGTLEYPINKNDPDGPKRQISKYAKWETIDEIIRPLLTEEGFALAFTTAPRQQEGGGLVVIAILRHDGGHKTETPMPVPLDTSGGKNNLQGYGSSLSYGKRYAATAALNLVTEGEDDDGKRGGMRFISDDQASELRDLLRQAGRQEGPFLDRLFSGAVRSIEEIEPGAYVVVRNTLDGIIHQQQQKAKT
jgi:hypothetical protein